MKVSAPARSLLLAAAALSLASSSHAAGSNSSVLIVGDSWATVMGAGSAVGVSFFDQKLREKKCEYSALSIAVPGTMATDWDQGSYLKALQSEAPKHDYVWIQLMGNDALDRMPGCASTGKSAEECGDELYTLMIKHMGNIVDAVHVANPKARVVGFGYDTMFGGLGCSLVTFDLFPQCFKHPGPSANVCFNTQFIRIQAVWEQIASNRSWVDAINLLGTTQMAAGYENVSIGHPDMTKMGPAKYWPDYEACFHPGVFGGDDSGAMVIMEEFYKLYWSRELGC